MRLFIILFAFLIFSCTDSFVPSELSYIDDTPYQYDKNDTLYAKSQGPTWTFSVGDSTYYTNRSPINDNYTFLLIGMNNSPFATPCYLDPCPSFYLFVKNSDIEWLQFGFQPMGDFDTAQVSWKMKDQEHVIPYLNFEDIEAYQPSHEWDQNLSNSTWSGEIELRGLVHWKTKEDLPPLKLVFDNFPIVD